MIRIPVVAAIALACAGGVRAQAHPDSASAVAAVAHYHDALAAGDSAMAVSLLSDDVIILESGAVETRAQYLGHHLGADMKASQGSKGVRTVIHVKVMGDAAFVVSKTATPPTGAQGSAGSEMAELMVLSRTDGVWKIKAVHWSSRRVRA